MVNENIFGFRSLSLVMRWIRNTLLQLGSTCVLCVIGQVTGFGQMDREQPVREGAGINLVPNGGFEEFSGVPLGWFFTGEDFSRVVRYWNSPTAASPDVYGPRVMVPSQWTAKGFGQATPYDGEAMAGITVYGCKGGKPHCREYLQIQLTEPLVLGQRYQLSFWTQHLPLSLRIDKLGAHFTDNPVRTSTDDPILETPSVISRGLLESNNGEWMKFGHDFTASATSKYLLIGNFYSDQDTRTSKCPAPEALPYAYYYIDEVALVKLPPILDLPVTSDDLSLVEIKKGKTVALHNIYFEHDHADLLPMSHRELNMLVSILQNNQRMEIEVRGHTDHIGADDYNMDLSLNRAKSVVEYLKRRGIGGERLHYRGYGSTNPIATNDTEDGRSMNRRVEFFVLQM